MILCHRPGCDRPRHRSVRTGELFPGCVNHYSLLPPAVGSTTSAAEAAESQQPKESPA